MEISWKITKNVPKEKLHIAYVKFFSNVIRGRHETQEKTENIREKRTGSVERDRKHCEDLEFVYVE